MVAADAVFLSYGVLTDDTAHYVRKLHDLAISGAVLVMELAAATGVPLGHSLWCSMVLSSGIATATVSGHRRFEKIEKDIWRIVKRSEMEQEQETHQKPG